MKRLILLSIACLFILTGACTAPPPPAPDVTADVEETAPPPETQEAAQKPSPSPIHTPAPSVEPAVLKTCKSIVKELPIHAGKDMAEKADIVAAIEAGDSADVIGEEGEYYEVRTEDGKTGYCLKDHLVDEATDVNVISYITKVDGLNIRSTPDKTKDDNIIGKFDRYEILYVLGEENGYFKICSDEGIVGYCYQEYMEKTTGAKAGKTYKTTAGDVNLRSSAEKESDDNIVGKLKKGDKVQVIGSDGDFYKILKDDGSVVFGYKKYLALYKPPPSSTPSKEDEPVASGDLPYYIYVEKGSYTLTIYKKDADGKYTKKVKSYRIAHGGNKTPAGKFKILSKQRWHSFSDGGCVQYACRYHSRLYLHSALYESKNNKTLWPKYYNGELGIGKSSTGGCLRMVCSAAYFIYKNCPVGTVIEIVNGSPKGTSSSGVPALKDRRIDPTDPNI